MGDAFTLLISQRGRVSVPTTGEMRWGAALNGTNLNDLSSHYVDAKVWSLSEFFDQYPRRGGPYVVLAQQISCMFG